MTRSSVDLITITQMIATIADFHEVLYDVYLLDESDSLSLVLSF